MTNSKTKAAAFMARLSGQWAITPGGMASFRHAVASFDWVAPADNTRWDQRETKVAHGVAVVPLIGVLTKYASMYDRWFDIVSAEWIEAEIDRLEADPSVRQVIILIDTPGGTVDGTTQLASRIARCSKKVIAVVSDACCSAGMWIASQCDLVTANAVADLGSIGVLMGFLDDSKMMADMGLEWHIVATSATKAAGRDGKFNDTLKAEWQRSVDETYEQFIQAVADGRSLSIDDVRRFADGRVFRAAEAASLGLIDRVADAAVAIDAIIQEVIAMTLQEFQSAAAANPTWVEPLTQSAVATAVAAAKPPIAAAADLKQAFGAAGDEKFLISRIGVDATMAEHKAAYGEHVKTQLAASIAEASRLKEQLAKYDPASAGTDALNTPREPGQQEDSPLVASAKARAAAASRN